MKQKIGIFDSGVGGLSILKTLLQSAASEFYYVADTAYLPYGQQTPETLIERGIVISKFFLQQSIETVVIACHTSCANALPILSEQFTQIHFVDMLAPTVLQAVAHSKNGTIGVFATQATIVSKAHRRLFQAIAPELKVIEQACPLLVPLIESSTIDDAILRTALEEYLEPIKKSQADTLVLGCTHYAFVEKEISQLAPELSLVSAHKEAEKLFQATELFTKKDVTFFVSGNIESFKEKAQQILPDLTEALYLPF